MYATPFTDNLFAKTRKGVIIDQATRGGEHMDDRQKMVEALEKEIVALPIGYISRKMIRGKVRQYHQWTEGGKKKSKYLDDTTAAELSVLIEKRRSLEKKLRELKKQLPKQKRQNTDEAYAFKSDVLIGKALKTLTESVHGFERRSCYMELENFLKRSHPGKVFILYGLRRTGKTTMIRQAIASLSERDFDKAAFIQVRPGITLGEINVDLCWLRDHDYQYVFIDEITLAEDFIEGAALLSDIYAASGIRIVLSGTDSLSFLLSESEELYDRCILLHTTWIPYREFERVLNVKGIDEYIRYGGTMSLGGKHYNEPITFKTRKSTDEYIDSAIARNIQHSLRLYQNGDHFRHLADLYNKNELTSAINRVIEDINHRFTLEVLTNDFKSHDLGISKRNLRKDRENPTDILDRIDEKKLIEGLRKALEILNQNEQSVTITDAHRIEIKEYLDLLDLTVDIPTEFIPVKDGKRYRTVVSQPGLRYSQAEALIQQLLLDKEFQNVSAVERAAILERILKEIRGRMMEEIILLETKMAYPGKQVFRLQFAIGEFDMVIVDPESITTEIYEIKHSAEMVPDQYKNLVDEEKCRATEFRFGTITKKAVIYRGKDGADGDIRYLNVEDYLRSLGRSSVSECD